mmetsp:Transcript_10005/g.37866  ORF Transcript_10005/g.37866 Transcript_10005/m.37866 type:complete len:100 (+) Transcript_10005:2003-2302(+)
MMPNAAKCCEQRAGESADLRWRAQTCGGQRRSAVESFPCEQVQSVGCTQQFLRSVRRLLGRRTSAFRFDTEADSKTLGVRCTERPRPGTNGNEVDESRI